MTQEQIKEILENTIFPLPERNIQIYQSLSYDAYEIIISFRINELFYIKNLISYKFLNTEFIIDFAETCNQKLEPFYKGIQFDQDMKELLGS